jgi:glucosamine 6-phosphate synthetase-like amidotransferase/phosphosugar isomerase protein
VRDGVSSRSNRLAFGFCAGGGAFAARVRSIRERVAAKGCHVVHLVDGEVPEVDSSTTVQLRSGLPEELTPISLAVLAQLLSHRVAVARGSIRTARARFAR